MGLRIRRATADDLPRIVEMLQQLSLDVLREDPGPPLPEAYQRAFEEVAADSRQQVLVAEAEGRVVATLTLVIVPNLSYRARSWAIVENIVVDEGERDKRYGESLMRHAVEEARQAGCYRVSLTCNKGRADARRFYERLGFVATHEGYRITF
jgi:N-acetylglutamate synthase-like GNAT family acetyltransferase